MNPYNFTKILEVTWNRRLNRALNFCKKLSPEGRARIGVPLNMQQTVKKNLRITTPLEHSSIFWEYRFLMNPYCEHAGRHGTGTTLGTDNVNVYLNFTTIF